MGGRVSAISPSSSQSESADKSADSRAIFGLTRTPFCRGSGGGDTRALLATLGLKGETRRDEGLEFGLVFPEGGVLMVGVGVLEG